METTLYIFKKRIPELLAVKLAWFWSCRNFLTPSSAIFIFSFFSRKSDCNLFFLLLSCFLSFQKKPRAKLIFKNYFRRLGKKKKKTRRKIFPSVISIGDSEPRFAAPSQGARTSFRICPFPLFLFRSSILSFYLLIDITINYSRAWFDSRKASSELGK